ncbi:flagellar hook-length control protein FliK [Herminiimonas sp. CN]|uniref:flagellar hook-length control protein FliK n=1 Tax=Herminiimonas sp. CN TaxID=1349818 RepID=UPI0004739778|nr:flagellar hook-length control protein FliK [Herminiimonas sp. CN]
MSGLTSLVDTMLATKLAERVDLVPLKPEVEIDGPEPVAGVEKVSNDVRLPSRAAMLRQLGPELVNARDGVEIQDASQRASQPSSANTTLSAAARAISAILGPPPGVASAVRGSAPVWSQPGAPVPQQLAAALARTVAASGLFYESHLSQFASGARTLAELAQEPQARLGPLMQTHPELLHGPATLAPQAGLATVLQAVAVIGEPPSTVQVVLNASNAPNVPVAAANPAGPVVGPIAGPILGTLPPDATDKTVATGPANASQPGAAATDAAPPVQHAGASHLPTPASVAAAYGATDPASPVRPAAPHHATAADADAASSAQSAAPEAARAGSQSQVAAGIHQDAVALVRQQLELLAVPVFRWSGEVWPGTQMDWELSEERNNPAETAEPEAAPRTWQTRLTMTLPTLGPIEVRLSLADTQLQAHLAAGAEASVAALRNDGDDLRQRFAAAGLQLTGLQIAPLAQKP